MLMVIIGAGASADSLLPERDGEWRPPLASELFDPRFRATLTRRKGAVVLAERVRIGVARGETVEQVLARLQADQSDPERPGQVLDLQFYLQELLWNCGAHWDGVDAGMNNYLTLVSDLEEWRSKAHEKIVYVTFNYDTLLESALSRRFRWVFEKPEDYLRPDYLVIKVHGSANWMQVTDNATVEGVGIQREQLIDAAGTLKRSDQFIVAGPGTTQYALFGAVPAIAVPAEPKADFVCPADHIVALSLALPQVEQVLCIGWRGADRNLVELMSGLVSPSVSSTIVTRRPDSTKGGTEAPQRVECTDIGLAWITEAGLTGPCQVIKSGFSGYVTEFLPTFVTSLTSLSH
jgi:hypothetical protein